MGDGEIAEAFRKFDVDQSGDLSTFELSNAIAGLVKRSPAKVQVASMIAATLQKSAAAAADALTLDQFTTLCKTYDWKSDEFTKSLADSIYEQTFETRPFGFHVRKVERKGLIKVRKIDETAPHLAGKVGVNDVIVAINGDPLGFVTDQSVLAQKIGRLALPIRITFERYRELGEADSDMLTVNSVTREDVQEAEGIEEDAAKEHQKAWQERDKALQHIQEWKVKKSAELNVVESTTTAGNAIDLARAEEEAAREAAVRQVQEWRNKKAVLDQATAAERNAKVAAEARVNRERLAKEKEAAAKQAAAEQAAAKQAATTQQAATPRKGRSGAVLRIFGGKKLPSPDKKKDGTAAEADAWEELAAGGGTAVSAVAPSSPSATVGMAHTLMFDDSGSSRGSLPTWKRSHEGEEVMSNDDLMAHLGFAEKKEGEA